MCGCMALAAPSMCWADAPSTGLSIPLSDQLLSMGIGGVILAVVVLPILRWMFVEMRSSREGFQSFLELHAQREEQLTADLRVELNRIADVLDTLQSAQLHDTREEVRRLRDVIGQLPFTLPRPFEKDKPT